MKYSINTNTIKKTHILLLLLAFTISSCNSKVSNTDNNSGTTNQEGYCDIHKKNCEELARDMGMTIDEYHSWQDKLTQEVATEDAMTDENGDIVGPDAASSEENVKTQKQWVNCKYCHGKGIEICSVCKGYGYERYSDGSRIGDDVCYYCKGNGTFGDCPKCDGRGQVLEEF